MSDAILFVQLGSPSDASPQNVEKYLVDFLGDPHTLGNPPFFWKWLLRGIIAPRRSVKSAEKYRRMIDSAGLGEMPLIHYTRLFAGRMSSEISRVPVRYAFEFGSKPSITDALAEFSKQGLMEICVVPLFPQRSLVTTVAVRDLAKAAFRKFPSLKMRFFDGFAMKRFFLDEILREIQDVWNGKSAVVFSFHGTPLRFERNGDPYAEECRSEFEFWRGKLLEIVPDAKILLSFQSRLGPVKWLEPYSVRVIESLGRQGESVLLVCPSFTADNLETLYEVDVELKQKFFAAGGKKFERVPCPNVRPEWIREFAAEIARELWRDVS